MSDSHCSWAFVTFITYWHEILFGYAKTRCVIVRYRENCSVSWKCYLGSTLHFHWLKCLLQFTGVHEWPHQKSQIALLAWWFCMMSVNFLNIWNLTSGAKRPNFGAKMVFGAIGAQLRKTGIFYHFPKFLQIEAKLPVSGQKQNNFRATVA